METYEVTLVIYVEAESPEQAVEEFQRYQRYQEPCYQVKDVETGRVERVWA